MGESRNLFKYEPGSRDSQAGFGREEASTVAQNTSRSDGHALLGEH